MAESILPDSAAQVQLAQLADVGGMLAYLPRATVTALLAAGRTTIELRFDLTQAAPGVRPERAAAGWISVKEAALRLVHSSPYLELASATAQISKAAGRGAFQSAGCGRGRRIDPISFDAWRAGRGDRVNDRDETSGT